MGLFQEVEGEAAILVENGVYKQVPVFKRDGYLFAKASGGFVRLYADGSTSKARMRLETMTWDSFESLGRDSIGKLCIASEVKGAQTLPSEHATKLLG